MSNNCPSNTYGWYFHQKMVLQLVKEDFVLKVLDPSVVGMNYRKRLNSMSRNRFRDFSA